MFTRTIYAVINATIHLWLAAGAKTRGAIGKGDMMRTVVGLVFVLFCQLLFLTSDIRRIFLCFFPCHSSAVGLV